MLLASKLDLFGFGLPHFANENHCLSQSLFMYELLAILTGKSCFIQFSKRMAGWLLLTFLICLHNQLSSIIHSIITFYVQSVKILNIFNSLTLKQIFWKRKTFFKKLEYCFLVESTKNETRHFHTKLP